MSSKISMIFAAFCDELRKRDKLAFGVLILDRIFHPWEVKNIFKKCFLKILPFCETESYFHSFLLFFYLFELRYFQRLLESTITSVVVTKQMIEGITLLAMWGSNKTARNFIFEEKRMAGVIF